MGASPSRCRNQSALPSTISNRRTHAPRRRAPPSLLLSFQTWARSAGFAQRPWGERSFYATDPFDNPLCFVARDSVFTGRTADRA